ncbi:MAG: CapA family protein, partial [Anaerolineae bacterium]|nr:CapA family protein [Anaerolineae bacterium]
ADLIWGHSPHHFQGVEWLGEAVSLYATGDLVDDYAVDPHFRNDRQLLFQISVRKGEVQAVRARPLKLGFARTGPAAGDDWRWIKNRFAEICGRLGSHVGVAEEGWLEVLPN